MDSRIATALQMTTQPVALLFADEKPEGAKEFVPGKWGCVIALVSAASKGHTAAVSRETCGCMGGRIGLGFQEEYDGPPGGIEYFLSTGRGEGFPEGEGYMRTPELAQEFADNLPKTLIDARYIILKPLSAVDPAVETPQEVIFLVNADQLTALVVLANYGQPGNEHVIIPQAAGCQGLGILAYREAASEAPRAVVGLMDVSARPFVDPNLVSFTVPFPMYQAMEADVPGSFFDRPAWQKVKARLGKTAKE